MIPKIIHYCWFGKKTKSPEIIECISSWKKFFKGWEIIEWNEDNFDLSKYTYALDAYKCKKWAFVSDVVRLDVLEKYGGIYLDVDVEFIRTLPCNYLNYEGILGFEHTHTIAPGLIFGIEKGSPFVSNILSSYNDERFTINNDGIYKTINTRITDYLIERGLILDNKFQVIDGIAIFPSEYFCGYDTDIREPDITKNTICWHHYLGSWSNISFKQKAQNKLKRIIGAQLYKKLIILNRKIRGNK